MDSLVPHGDRPEQSDVNFKQYYGDSYEDESRLLVGRIETFKSIGAGAAVVGLAFLTNGQFEHAATSAAVSLVSYSLSSTMFNRT